MLQYAPRIFQRLPKNRSTLYTIGSFPVKVIMLKYNELAGHLRHVSTFYTVVPKLYAVTDKITIWRSVRSSNETRTVEYSARTGGQKGKQIRWVEHNDCRAALPTFFYNAVVFFFFFVQTK